jgi:hypothetical protein
MYLHTSIIKYLSENTVIIAALLSFSLLQIATFIRDFLCSKRKARSVRKIIEIEIDYNLNLLTILRKDVDHLKPDKSNRESLSFPTWHRKAFESQLSILSDALDEDEITEIFDFYGNLDKLIVIYCKISDLTNSSDQAHKSGTEANRSDNPVKYMLESTALWNQASTIRKDCLEQWKDFEQLLKDIHEKGNPLNGYNDSI